MNCNTTHYRANSSSVPGDPTALVFALACFPALVVWCLFGVAIRQFLTSPRALRITNLVLAALVALSVVLLFV